MVHTVQKLLSVKAATSSSGDGLSAQHSTFMLPSTGARHIGHRPSWVRNSGAQAEQVQASTWHVMQSGASINLIA